VVEDMAALYDFLELHSRARENFVKDVGNADEIELVAIN